ncbi:MAG: hypothetical protein K2K45_09555 [Muribaculaceae bacterium]|nr:hypothetical protein [Muribaculaceae bacterium]
MNTLFDKKYIHTLFSSIVLTIVLGCITWSCTDDLLYKRSDFPNDGTLHMSVAFEPLYGIDNTTRTSGDAIKGLKSLSILFYNTEGKLVTSVTQWGSKPGEGDESILGWDLKDKGNTSMPSAKPADTPDNAVQAEDSTALATFRLKDIPMGKYHIYAVANMGDLSNDESTFTDKDGNTVTVKEAIETEKGLKSIKLTWNSNIASNDQMFGYFSPQLNNEDAYNKPGDFDAPEVIVSDKTPKLYAWVRRAASKVTIAYDGSNLKDNVWIYIHKVTIRDIPRTCMLGEINSPNAESQLDPEGGSLYYNNDGVTLTDPSETDHEQWLKITNENTTPVGSDHSKNAQALFFYENMQGDYKDLPEDERKKYDKHQSASPEHGVLVDPGDPDYKDEVPYGTWVEVEAFYRSDNPDNITSGDIIYRFMLGKDVEYNYNAERNHHFKLTLKFNGWANQADWHIEYTEDDPAIKVQQTFYMPYLYNQKAMLPLKLNGKPTSLHVQIIENGWAPVNTTSPYNVPAQTVGDFQWNLPAYNQFGPTTYPQLGFLALAVPNDEGDPEKNIINKDYRDHSAVTDLKNYYEEKHITDGYEWSQCDRWYDVSPGIHQKGKNDEEGNNQYTVTKADQGESYSVQIPLWTRNKTMIENSGYTGNNPYEAYDRKAVIRITAEFEDHDPLHKDVTIIQSRRIVNPKGIWRSYSNNDPFFVHMMTLASPNASGYTPYPNSGSWSATIESGDMNFCYLTPENSEEEQKVINGKTDSEIKFNVRFHGNVTSGNSKGCVVSVKYNGGSCVHKILVRQGYDEAVEIVKGGAKWSSFNLYSCEAGHDGADYSTIIPAEVSCNPLGIGSLFKRRNYSNAILVSNNATYGPMVSLNGNTLKVKSMGGAERDLTWANISGYPATTCSDDRFGTIRADNIVGTNDTRWARFSAIPPGSNTPKTYRVPTYDDYKALDDAEYAIGIVYADGAPGTRDTFDAYEYEDGSNNQKTSPLGMRGYIVYNKDSGNQIFFPLGKYGMARRTQSYLPALSDRGYLRYAGVYDPLTGDGNLWRPIPYDMPSCPGAVYWIDNAMVGSQYHNDGACGGWDMNYFSLDFSSYSYTNLNDACPVKLIWIE